MAKTHAEQNRELRIKLLRKLNEAHGALLEASVEARADGWSTECRLINLAKIEVQKALAAIDPAARGE